jgi:hypothetical protein
MNPIALLSSVLALPFSVALDVKNVWEDRRAIKRNGLIADVSRRHVERSIGRLVLLLLVLAIGLVSLNAPFSWPTTPRGWLVLSAFLLIPILVQLDGVRDHQLRAKMRQRVRPVHG